MNYLHVAELTWQGSPVRLERWLLLGGSLGSGRWEGGLEAVTPQYPQESFPGSMHVCQGSWEGEVF